MSSHSESCNQSETPLTNSSIRSTFDSTLTSVFSFFHREMKSNRLEVDDDRKKESESVSLNISDNLTIATDDKHLTDIFHQIKASKTPAVINYGASWCQVCSQILPSFCQLSKNFSKLSFVYADIDECPETTQHIRYTPSFHFYRDGERVDEMIGAGVERLHDRLWLHS